MCGIAGYFGSRTIEAVRLERCLKLMHHRGPDAGAYRSFRNETGRNAYLLSTRLDIIDLDERSNQPLEVGKAWLSYNGELYNYVELRDSLQSRGHRFSTTSDTEVLAAALVEDGFGALDECEGMWAFAFYTSDEGVLTLCRDRFGEKPLHVYRDETGIYWGSEPLFIFELLGRRLEPDLDHLFRYLVNGYRSLYKQRSSFFKGLEELKPGTLLRIGPDGRDLEAAYWSPDSTVDTDMEYDDAVASVRSRLIRSVELRLRADVPLAFCMSGGVDSLSLISIARNVFAYDVHGFTIVNEDERYAEQEMVDHAVASLGIRHTSVTLATDSFLPKLRAIIAHRAAPLYTISYFAHWLLMQAIAADGYRISVSGSAADELFTGYYDHHLGYLHEVRGEPDVYAASLRSWQEHVLPVVRNPFLQNPQLFAEDPDQRGYIYLNADEFRSYLRGDWFEPFVEKSFTDSLLRNRMLNELFEELVPPTLHEDDLNAMHFSIENRSPFLDRPLFELSTRIPTRHLVRNGYAKAILRDAMRGIVPDQVIDSRRKVGFNAPIHALLDPRDPETRAELLGESPIYAHVRREAIEQLLDKEFLPNSESKFLFNFINAKIFLEEFAA
jgi:asparagine synthase (glutamine-hydrolysing)